MIIIKADNFNQYFLYILPNGQQPPGVVCYHMWGRGIAEGIGDMTHRALQDLIGRAIVDKDYRDQLLNGNREQALAQLDLTDEERTTVDSIEAQSLEEFAGQLHDWIEAVGGESGRRPSRLFRLLK